MALNMLRAEKGKTASIRRKQKIAAMNSDYLEQVILAGITAANKNWALMLSPWSKSILPQIIKLPKQDLENKPIEIETLLQLQYKFLLDLSDE